MIGECLCRQVRVEIARRPDYINICNCRFYRSLGAAWAYLPAAEVTVSGGTAGFQRDDIDDPWLSGHHCPRCGSTTRYLTLKGRTEGQVGVNTGLFAQDELDGIAVVYQAGRQVWNADDPFITTGHGRIGKGKAF
jgi:hypothetical protein